LTLVTRIIGPCPRCLAERAFGNVSVGPESVSRGCIACDFREYLPLPAVKKKVLYLDQFFFSRAFRAKPSGHDEKYQRAIARICDLAHKQLLVAPYSTIHEDEAHQWAGKEDKTSAELMRFIKDSSGGHEFAASWKVQREQILAAFTDYIDDKPSKNIINPDDALPRNVHGWTDYFWIEVGGYNGDAIAVAKAKKQSVDELVDAFPRWRASKSGFEEHLALEYRHGGQAYLKSYFDYVMQVGSGDISAIFSAPLSSAIVEQMLCCFDRKTPDEERILRVVSFFASEHFEAIPYEWLSARIFTVLRDQVRRGASSNSIKAKRRLSGIFQDIDHIATFAPYCDAVFIDRQMESLVRDGRIALSKRFGTLVFCEANWKDFELWLDKIENSLSQTQADALKIAYPNSIANPVDEMKRIVAERNK
jgi:hypothetical protein